MNGWKDLATLIGRILLVVIFLMSGTGKIGNFTGTTQVMAEHGMPMVTFFAFGAIFLELAGGLSVVLGYFARFGALLLIIFLIPTTLIFHGHVADPGQKIHFLKNVSMFGGLLILLSAGPGRISLDYLLRGKRRG